MYLKRNNELEVMQLFLHGFEKELYLREISNKTKLPLKTTQNTLSLLEKNKILKARTVGKNKYFCLNKENIETKFFLEHAELYKTQLFLQKYPLFKTFLKTLQTEAIIVLFGSYAKGTADKNSDCDLLIISEKKEEIPYHLLPYKVHEISIGKEAYKKAREKNENLIKEIEENHVVFNNHSLFVDFQRR